MKIYRGIVAEISGSENYAGRGLLDRHVCLALVFAVVTWGCNSTSSNPGNDGEGSMDSGSPSESGGSTDSSNVSKSDGSVESGIHSPGFGCAFVHGSVEPADAVEL